MWWEDSVDIKDRIPTHCIVLFCVAKVITMLENKFSVIE